MPSAVKSWWTLSSETVGFYALREHERLELDELCERLDELSDEMAVLQAQRRTLLNRAREREYRRQGGRG
jgi:hypothetical protein